MKRKNGLWQMRPAFVALMDAALIGLALVVFALFDHVLPRRLDTKVSQEHRSLVAQMEAARAQERVPAQETQETGRLGEQFADRFMETGSVWAEGSYTGKNLAVTLSRGQWGESVYYVQDIYLRDVECLRTAFAHDTFGTGYREDMLELSGRKQAVGAINGDFYSVGVMNSVIRNGELYWDVVDPFESLLVLYRDGNMEVFEGGKYTITQLLEKGAWQTWSFGPSLLDGNGKALTEFERKNPEENPRTAIGMVEPGHYMFLVVDGRQRGYSKGATYVDLAMLCESLKMKVAYNLDGGGSVRMTFDGKIANHPSEERELSDIVYVVDTDAP